MQPTITRVHLLATQQNRTVDSNETISFNQEELATKAALITLTVALICLISAMATERIIILNKWATKGHA